MESQHSGTHSPNPPALEPILHVRAPGQAGRQDSQLGGDLFGGVRLNDVTGLEIVVTVDADAAFHAGAHFVDLVLKAAEGLDVALEEHVFAAADADLALDHAPIGDDAAGDVAAFGEVEHLANFGRADDDFLEHRVKQACHGLLHLVDEFVNNGVELDLDSFALGDIGHAGVNARVEAEDDPLGRAGQQHVRFGDRADGAVDDFEGDLAGLDFLERLDDGFDGALGIGFDDDLEHLGGGFGESLEKVFEGDFGPLFLGSDGFGFFGPGLRQFAGRPVVFKDAEFGAGFGHAVQAKYFYRNGRARLFEALAVFIDERAHAPVVLAANHRVAHLQRAFTDEDRGRGATGFEAGFDDIAARTPIGVGLELQEVGPQDDHLQQMWHALLGQGGNLDERCLTA